MSHAAVVPLSPARKVLDSQYFIELLLYRPLIELYPTTGVSDRGGVNESNGLCANAKLRRLPKTFHAHYYCTISE